MHRIMMKSKIHRATITGADLNYIGSITLDTAPDGARRHPRARAGARARHRQRRALRDLRDPGGPGDVILNGAAARLVHPGDKVIVITYAQYDEAELAGYEPVVVHVDEHNQPTMHSVREVAP